jgi:hypothetical protein
LKEKRIGRKQRHEVEKQMAMMRRWFWLLAVSAAVVAVWGYVLPRVARFEPVARDMQFLESRGIDPSARYYTDQPIGWRSAAAIEEKVSAEPEAFWGGSK